MAGQACPPASASLPNVLSGSQTPHIGPVHGHLSDHDSSTKMDLALAVCLLCSPGEGPAQDV